MFYNWPIKLSKNYFEIEFLSSPKKWKTVFLHTYFLTYDYKSCLAVTYLSDWLTILFLSILEKNQKYLFIINLLTFLLQMKFFLRNNIAFKKSRFHAHTYSSCDCAAAFISSHLEGLRKVRVTINSSREVHFLVRAQITGL